jgi:multiple sugar transport system substrate-binding protein
MGTVELTVLCWDHPRCVAPLKAAATAWRSEHPEVGFEVTARPLAAFNDQPVTEIASTADLLFVDHPMMGRVAQERALLPLEDLVPADTLAALTADSLGASQESYRWEGRHWATAVDAACQVAVVDERSSSELGPLRRWDDVLELARRRPGSVAIPLYPSDAVLSLLSISADLRACGAAEDDDMWPRAAVEILCELTALVDPRSFEVNRAGGNRPAVCTPAVRLHQLPAAHRSRPSVVLPHSPRLRRAPVHRARRRGPGGERVQRAPR